MRLTKEEKNLILANRAKKEAALPKKLGYCKEDLYTVKEEKFYSDAFYFDQWFFSSKEKEKIIKEFENYFELGCPAGTEFICFINNDGSESWYDQINYGIENMNADWAEKYLTDIKPLKKKK